MAAPRRAAVANPDGVAAAIDAIVVRDFLARRDIAQGNYEAPAPQGLHIDVRIAGVVDMPFRHLHEHDFAACKIVAVARVVDGRKRTCPVNDAGIVQRVHGFAFAERPRGEHPEALNRRRPDYDAVRLWRVWGRPSGLCHPNRGRGLRGTIAPTSRW